MTRQSHPICVEEPHDAGIYQGLDDGHSATTASPTLAAPGVQNWFSDVADGAHWVQARESAKGWP